VASLVMPGLKMSGLSWADTEQNSQHFRVAHPLSKRWIEAGATLLDERKVKSRRVGNGLDVVIRHKVVVGSRNCGKLPLTQTRDCLRKHKRGIEIGVVSAAPVPSPPTGVHSELHEVC